MTIKTNTTSRGLYTEGDESAYDVDNVTLTTDYAPLGPDGVTPIPCRGFIISGNAGAVRLRTLAGTDVTIPSGLAVGIEHAIGFTRIYSGSTTATGLIALT